MAAKDVWYFILFLVMCQGVSGSDSNRSDGFQYRPHNQCVPEGVNATFWCLYEPSENILQLVWLINGNSTNEIFASATPPMAISVSTKILSNGAAVSVLTIGALPEYDGTVVTCEANIRSANQVEICNTSAVLSIKAPPGAVNNPTLHSSPTELKLTWIPSPNTTDYAVQYCVQVYQIMGEARIPVTSECIINRTTYVFNTSEGVPDPNVLFEFVITPRYYIAGAVNGTSSNISGYFVADPPTLPQESMDVDVAIAKDLSVNLNVTLRNAESWISGGTKVDEFLIKVVLSAGQSYDCSPVHRLVTSNSTLSLHANCSDLPERQLGNVTVTAINSNGSTNLTTTISTHFIQDIRSQPCYDSSRCQVEVVYNVVADPQVVTGSFIFLNHGDDELQYFANRRLDSGAHDRLSLSGLSQDCYDLLVFPLNGSGLPFTFPANQPRRVIKVPVTADIDGDHDKRETHLKGFKHTGGSCFRCKLTPSSSASHCVVIVHTNDKMINVSLFERNGDVAHGCVAVEPGPYFIVAFGYGNETILGRPYVAGRMHLDRGQESDNDIPITAIIITSLAIFVVILVVAAIVALLVWYFLWYQRKTVRDDEQVQLRDVISFSNAPQAHHVQFEELGTVTSMEELLSRFEGKNSDWSAIHVKLVALDKRELAEKVYREYVLPKLEEQQEDSGRFTQTTSTSTGSNFANGDRYGQDDAPAEVTEEDRFGGPQSERGRSGVSSVIAHVSEAECGPDDSESERGMHKQATSEADDGRDYSDNVRETLSTNLIPEGADLDHPTHDKDGAQAIHVPVDEGERSDIIPFMNVH